MRSPLARRVDAVAAAVGLGPPSAALFVVDSWSARREMCRLLGLGAPSLAGAFSFRMRSMRPPDALPDPAADAALKAEIAARRRAEFAALAPLPRDTPPLALRARAALGASVRTGAPMPVLDPFVVADRIGPPARVLGDGEHAGLVGVTPAFAAEWTAEWERGRAGGEMSNLEGDRALFYYWRM